MFFSKKTLLTRTRSTKITKGPSTDSCFVIEHPLLIPVLLQIYTELLDPQNVCRLSIFSVQYQKILVDLFLVPCQFSFANLKSGLSKGRETVKVLTRVSNLNVGYNYFFSFIVKRPNVSSFSILL